MGRVANKEGSVRQLEDGRFECIVQSKYLNPKTAKPKRFKRVGDSEELARANAQKSMKAWEKEFEAGRDTKITKSKPFGKYMEEYIETVRRPKLTDSGYHSYISALNCNFYNFPISNYQLHMLNAQLFTDYYNELLSLKSKKTCSIPRQLCVGCCEWLKDKSLLDENYAKQGETGIKQEVVDEYNHAAEERNKNSKEIFTNEDIKKFYYAYKNNIGQYPPVVLFLLETGLRISEFTALRNANINLDERTIAIVETQALRYKDKDDKDKGVEYYTKVPKNKKPRTVYLSDLALELVKYMREQTKLNCNCNKDDLLYPTFRNGKRRSTSSCEVCFKDLCDKLKIDRDVHITKQGNQKGLCLHSLRHTYDSIANTAKGANVVVTALAMGHQAIKTENIYTHAPIEALSRITTPSKAVLDEYKPTEEKAQEKPSMSQEELYEMYLKLKEMFE